MRTPDRRYSHDGGGLACASCGMGLRADAKFCDECGMPVRTAALLQQLQSVPTVHGIPMHQRGRYRAIAAWLGSEGHIAWAAAMR